MPALHASISQDARTDFANAASECAVTASAEAAARGLLSCAGSFGSWNADVASTQRAARRKRNIAAEIWSARDCLMQGLLAYELEVKILD